MFRSLKAAKERTKIRFVLWKEMNSSVEDRAGMRGVALGAGSENKKNFGTSQTKLAFHSHVLKQPGVPWCQSCNEQYTIGHDGSEQVLLSWTRPWRERFYFQSHE